MYMSELDRRPSAVIEPQRTIVWLRRPRLGARVWSFDRQNNDEIMVPDYNFATYKPAKL